MNAEERVKRLIVIAQNEIAEINASITEKSPAHQDRYKIGFIAALEWMIEVNENEINAINAAARVSAGGNY